MVEMLRVKESIRVLEILRVNRAVVSRDRLRIKERQRGQRVNVWVKEPDSVVEIVWIKESNRVVYQG